jgi:hypothetical protein
LWESSHGPTCFLEWSSPKLSFSWTVRHRPEQSQTVKQLTRNTQHDLNPKGNMLTLNFPEYALFFSEKAKRFRLLLSLVRMTIECDRITGKTERQ